MFVLNDAVEFVPVVTNMFTDCPALTLLADICVVALLPNVIVKKFAVLISIDEVFDATGCSVTLPYTEPLINN